jgi:hypothetical protein
MPSEICELRPAMNTETILFPVEGAAAAAADSRARAWRWRHVPPSAAACLHRW